MKTIFWNVDTQYDFMRDDETFHGALAIPCAREIEGNLEKLTKLAKEQRIMVINTADWHTKDSKEISRYPDYKTTFPEHCMQGTKGANYIPATEPLKQYIAYIDWSQNGVNDENLLIMQKNLEILSISEELDIVIYKDHFDVFKGNPYTEKVLKLLNPEAAVVYGVATNVCVNYAVLGLLERGIKVYIPTDAIKELPGLPLEEVLKSWKQKGVILTKTSDVSDIVIGGKNA